MFDITTCRDFHRKLRADFEDFAKEQASARLPSTASLRPITFTNGCGATGSRRSRRMEGTRDQDKESLSRGSSGNARRSGQFRTCEWREAFHSRAECRDAPRRRVRHGPYGVGPFGASYLLIDYGVDAGEQRYKTARDLIESVVSFWNGFFERYLPKRRASRSSGWRVRQCRNGLYSTRSRGCHRAPQIPRKRDAGSRPFGDDPRAENL